MAENLLDGKVAKLEKDIKYLRNLAINHYGDIGEDIHGLPSDGEAGFMPFNLYEKNQALFESRKFVTGVSVDSLEPGFYSANYLTDTPKAVESQALALIDVSDYGDGRKLITYRQAYSNVAWNKTVHIPTGTPDGKGWIKQTSSNVLWKGAVSAVNSTITLSDLKSNYDFLGIIVEGVGHNATSQIFTTSRGAYAVGVTNTPDKVDINIAHTEVSLDFGTSQTAVKITENKTIYVSAQSSGVIEGALGTVTAIVGLNF